MNTDRKTVNLFLRIGFDLKRAENTLKFKNIARELKEVILEAGVADGCSKAVGDLLYMVAVNFPPHAFVYRPALVRDIVKRKIKSRAQLKIALGYLRSRGSQPDILQRDLDQACGIDSIEQIVFRLLEEKRVTTSEMRQRSNAFGWGSPKIKKAVFVLGVNLTTLFEGTYESIDPRFELEVLPSISSRQAFDALLNTIKASSFTDGVEVYVVNVTQDDCHSDKQLRQLVNYFANIFGSHQITAHPVLLESTRSAGPALVQYSFDMKADYLVIGSKYTDMSHRNSSGTTVSDHCRTAAEDITWVVKRRIENPERISLYISGMCRGRGYKFPTADQRATVHEELLLYNGAD